MSPRNPQAEAAIEKLLAASEGDLYETLGIRARALASSPELAGSFDPQVTYSVHEMGALDDVRAFGRRLFARWSKEAHKLVCGTDPEDAGDRKKLEEALGMGNVTFAGLLATLLTAHFGLAPALAAVVAAIVLRVFFRPTLEEICASWHASLAN